MADTEKTINRSRDSKWKERAHQQRWFAGDRLQNQNLEDEIKEPWRHANAGWTRPSSPTRPREWGYYRGYHYGDDRSQDGKRGLAIDFTQTVSRAEQVNWRYENMYKQGVDAERELSRERSQEPEE